MVVSSPPRETVWLAQTRRSLNVALLLRAHKKGERLAVTMMRSWSNVGAA